MTSLLKSFTFATYQKDECNHSRSLIACRLRALTPQRMAVGMMEFNQIMLRIGFGQCEEENTFKTFPKLTNCLCANSNHLYSFTIHISTVFAILLKHHNQDITSMLFIYLPFSSSIFLISQILVINNMRIILLYSLRTCILFWSLQWYEQSGMIDKVQTKIYIQIRICAYESHQNILTLPTAPSFAK